jgi:hypothetical protein
MPEFCLPRLMGAKNWNPSARAKADAEAAARRAADAQVLVDSEALIAAWNERQVGRMLLLFAPTIGARACDQVLFPVSG